MTLLEVIDLHKTYGSRRATVAALDGVSVQVEAGKTLAVVGESGSGKSTLGSIVAGLTASTSGEVTFRGAPLVLRRTPALRREIQMVFQSPFQSLNPRMRVGSIIREPLRLLAGLTGKPANDRVAELLDLVGLPAETESRLPRELSGGQQQRVAIARALAPRPDLIVLDEPTSGLDQSVRGRIVSLLRDLQHAQGVAYVFITHDLAVARAIAHDVVVMQNGRIIERGSRDEVLVSPQEEYTRSLIAAVPITDPAARRRRVANSHALTTHLIKENTK